MQTHFPKWRTAISVVLVYMLGASDGSAIATDPTIDVDWSSKTAGCLGKLDAAKRYTVLVHDINDVALTDGFLPAYNFSIRATGTPVVGAIQNAAPVIPASVVALAFPACPGTRKNAGADVWRAAHCFSVIAP